MAKLVLPDLDLLSSQPKIPHRKRILATYDAKRPGRAIIRYTLVENWPRTKWYVHATLPEHGMRASNTLATTSATRAEEWRRAIEAGDVAVADYTENPKALTKKQLEALVIIGDAEKAGRPASVWDFGSTTVNRLRGEGLIETRDGKCYLTDKGRTARSYVRNPGEPIFVSITPADGRNKRVIRCDSDDECIEVIREEARHSAPHTIFNVIGEDEGVVVPLDRWGLDARGKLVHAPYHAGARRRADTMPVTTRRSAQ